MKEILGFIVGGFMLCALFDYLRPLGCPLWVALAAAGIVMVLIGACKTMAEQAEKRRQRTETKQIERAAQLGTQTGLEMAFKQIAERYPEALRNSGPVSITLSPKDKIDGQSES
jgi:hypothetical protein